MNGTSKVFVDAIPICSTTAFVIPVTDTSSSGLTGLAVAPAGLFGLGF